MINRYTPNPEIQALTTQQQWPADKFFPHYSPDALTYKEVSLWTHYSNILPFEVDTTVHLTEQIILSNPLVSADMDTVTDYEMAIAMALNGGMGFIHGNLRHKQKLKSVKKVKHYEYGVIDKPINIPASWTIWRVMSFIEKQWYKFSTFPVIENWVIVWLLGWSVVDPMFRGKKVWELMKPISDLKSLKEKDLGENPIDTAYDFFISNPGITKLLISDGDKRLKWLITLSDISRIKQEEQIVSSIKPTRDEKQRLRVGTTVKAKQNSKRSKKDRDNFMQEVGELVDAGVDILAVSTAHGFSEGVWDTVELIRKEFKDLDILAWNVTNPEWVEFLAERWANAIKIWQWPGSICTTREQTGVGIPQMTAVYYCSKAAKLLWVRSMADGWITASWDMVKALTQADTVMIWSLVAASDEAPWDTYEVNGTIFKAYRGMWSIEAMQAGSANRYGQDVRKLSPEWINAMKKAIGPVKYAIRQFHGSIQAWLGYHGARNLGELKQKARFVRMSPAGQEESRPHDVTEIKTK